MISLKAVSLTLKFKPSSSIILHLQHISQYIYIHDIEGINTNFAGHMRIHETCIR